MSSESNTQLIYARMAEVMSKVGAVPKSQVNSGYGEKYNFRGIDQLFDALNKPMSEAKIFAMPYVQKKEVTERKTARGGIIYHTELDVVYRFYCEDGSFVETRVFGEALDMSDKGTNIALQAAYKYACFQIFNIPVSPDAIEDADGRAHQVEPIKKQASAPKSATGLNDLKNHADNIGITKEQKIEIFNLLAKRGASQVKFAQFLREKIGSDNYDDIRHNYFNRIVEIINEGKFDEPKKDDKKA